MLGIGRDLVRRGLDDSTLDSFRIGQNIVWRRWMGIAFALTDDPQELRELLDHTAASIAAFIDAMSRDLDPDAARARRAQTRHPR